MSVGKGKNKGKTLMVVVKEQEPSRGAIIFATSVFVNKRSFHDQARAYSYQFNPPAYAGISWMGAIISNGDWHMPMKGFSGQNALLTLCCKTLTSGEE